MSNEEKVILAREEKLSDRQRFELDQAKKALEVERAKWMIAAPVKSYKLTPEEIEARYGPPGVKLSSASSLDNVRFMQRKPKEDESVGRTPGTKDKSKRKSKQDKRINPVELEDQQVIRGKDPIFSPAQAKQIAENVADILDADEGDSVIESAENVTESAESVIETSENVTEPPHEDMLDSMAYSIGIQRKEAEPAPVIMVDPRLSVQHIQGPCTLKFPEGAVVEPGPLLNTASGIVSATMNFSGYTIDTEPFTPSVVPLKQKSLTDMMADEVNAIDLQVAAVDARIKSMKETIIQLESNQVELSTARNVLIMALTAMHNIEKIRE